MSIGPCADKSGLLDEVHFESIDLVTATRKQTDLLTYLLTYTNQLA